jgi:DNA-binding transcriptional MerR regulator
MMDETRLFSMEELLDEYNSQVRPEDRMSERTVRYYVVEGLLPRPEKRGQRALYTRRHLERLLLIRRLKDDEYLSLDRIHAVLTQLDEDEASWVTPAEAGDPPERAQAKQLVARLLHEAAGGESEYRAGQTPSPTIPPAPREERWRHIDLADGLLLLVRQPTPSRTEDLVRKLIEVARTAHKKEP